MSKRRMLILSECLLRFWRGLEIFNTPTAPSARDANDQTKVATLRRVAAARNRRTGQDAAFAFADDQESILQALRIAAVGGQRRAIDCIVHLDLGQRLPIPRG